jgi:hypothetical protein
VTYLVIYEHNNILSLPYNAKKKTEVKALIKKNHKNKNLIHVFQYSLYIWTNNQVSHWITCKEYDSSSDTFIAENMNLYIITINMSSFKKMFSWINPILNIWYWETAANLRLCCMLSFQVVYFISFVALNIKKQQVSKRWKITVISKKIDEK